MSNRDLTQIKKQIVQITRTILQGRIGTLQGCLLLAPLCSYFDTNENQEMITFIVVADELQKLAESRGGTINIAQESEFDTEWNSILEMYRSHILESCQIDYDKFITDEQQARYKLVKICNELLAGEIDFWNGCCRIAGGRLALPEPEQDDPLLLGFEGIDSEIETCPRGKTWRAHCDPVYLAEKDKSLEDYRKCIEQSVYDDCREIIKRYDD